MAILGALLKPKLEEIKKVLSKKSFAKWSFLALVLKKLLYFLKIKLFLYFGKRKPRKDLHIFQEKELSYI